MAGPKSGSYRDGWQAPFVVSLIEKCAGDIVIRAGQSVDWENPQIDYLGERVAFALTKLRIVSIVVSSRLRNRDAWYKAISRIEEYGICCARVVVIDNVSNCPTGSHEGLLRIIVLADEARKFHSTHSVLGHYTRVLHQDELGEKTEFDVLYNIVRKWKDDWQPID